MLKARRIAVLEEKRNLLQEAEGNLLFVKQKLK